MLSKHIYVFSKKQFFLVVSFFLLAFTISAQTTVNSLSALKPYLDDNNANVKLASGTYTIDASNVQDFGNPVLLFSGNNSTYDFTGVTINFDQEIFFEFGNVDVQEIAIEGNDNVLKNLNMVDVGGLEDRPRRTALGIRMDGEDNLVEGFDMLVKGSYPYGYGDAFGKGSGFVIKHYKHSAILVRGNRNHVKDCDIIHRSYGHGIFMQGAVDAVIEGCTLEGETRTTDDMLAEEGTNTVADDEDFITVWGYKLPAGYTMSLNEDGIRAYNNGTTIINGVTYESRRTENITVRNCTVVNMRDGISLALGDGDKIAENCTVLGCEAGFTLSSGTRVINGKADAVHGPVYRNIYGRSGIDVEIELVSGNGAYNNGSKAVAYLGGGNNDITFTSSETNIPQDYNILVGGAFDDVRYKNGHLDYQHNHPVEDTDLVNNSGFSIYIPSISSDNDIETCGPVIGNTSANNISNSNNCEQVVELSCEGYDAFSVIQAESFCSHSGIQTGDTNSKVGWINNGDWVKYEALNFGSGVRSMSASVSSGGAGGTIEVRRGSASGNLLGSLKVENTGNWNSFNTIESAISSVTGEQDIYLVFKGEGTDYLFDVDSFQFTKPETKNINIRGAQVEASLLFREEFNNDLSNWVVEAEEPETVQIENGKLDIEVISGCVLWYKEWLKGPIMIEFDAVPIDEGGDLDRVSDLNSFVLASDLDGNPADFFNDSEERNENEAHLSLYDPFGMYYVGHGGGNNSRIRFRRYDGEGERPLLPEHDLPDEEYRLIANENHHIRIIVYGNRFQYYYNDVLIYDWEDPNTPYSEGYYGFRTTTTHWELDNYEFYSLSEELETPEFIPDPSKTYYIDAPHHNLRLAADGNSEDPYTTSTNTTGEDVEWKFVQNNNGYWHIQRATGGSTPRLRTDNTEFADMQGTAWSGTYTYYEITPGFISNSYFLTLPNGPSDHQRLQINSEGNARFVPTSHALTWESFRITEAGNLTGFSRIEAEDFHAMNGIQTEQSTESGENVGYVENGDWIRFDDVNLSGAQSVDLRVASRTGGTIEIRTGSTNGTLIGSVNVSNTGGWQNWDTVNTSINNANGTQDVYLVFKGGDDYLLNVNWLEFSSSSTSAKSIGGIATNEGDIIIYPNPVDATTNIQGAQGTTLEVYNMKGSLLVTKNITSELEEINLGSLSSGIYYAKISSSQNVDTIKIVKQ